MNNRNISDTLKKLRTASNKSASVVIQELNQTYGFSLAQSTLYGYENGHSCPDVDVFLALCMIYNCRDILYTFGYTDKPNAFTVTSPEDALIVEKYNNLTPSGKNMILGALGIEKDNIKQKIS